MCKGSQGDGLSVTLGANVPAPDVRELRNRVVHCFLITTGIDHLAARFDFAIIIPRTRPLLFKYQLKSVSNDLNILG